MNGIRSVKPRLVSALYCQTRLMGQIGDLGSGVGKGGGGGGSIRDAGGSFGRMEAAHEDQYFYNQQKQQLAKMKMELQDEIKFHEEQIKNHQDAINRHKLRVKNIDQER